MNRIKYYLFSNKYDVLVKNVRPITKKISQASVKKLLIVKDDLQISAVMGLLHKDWWLLYWKILFLFQKTYGEPLLLSSLVSFSCFKKCWIYYLYVSKKMEWNMHEF